MNSVLESATHVKTEAQQFFWMDSACAPAQSSLRGLPAKSVNKDSLQETKQNLVHMEGGKKDKKKKKKEEEEEEEEEEEKKKPQDFPT